MDNEVYRDLTHEQVKQVAGAWLASREFEVRTEVKIPSGRIVDVAGINPRGEIWIIECRSRRRLADLVEAHKKYGGWAHKLYLAAPQSWVQELRFARKAGAGWFDSYGVGLIHAEHCLLTVDQEAAFRRVPASAQSWMRAAVAQATLRM